MRTPLFSRGIVHLGGIFVGSWALAASLSIAACSGDAGGTGTDTSAGGSGGGAGANGAAGGDDASSGTPSGDDGGSSGTPSGTGSGSGSPSSGAGSGSPTTGTGSGSPAGSGADDAGGSPGTGTPNPTPTSTSPGAPAPAPDAGNGGSPGPSPSAVTFTQVFTTILSPTCGRCHGNDAPMMSFANKTTAYNDLVNVKAMGTSCRSSGETRVVPGSAATSLLYMKVAGTETCGARMPKGLTALSAANIALIQQWINQGAMND